MLPIQGPGFVLALLVGLILWILLRGVSKRSWQAAVLIGAVCHYVVPAAFIAVGMFVVLQGVDWRVFSRGLVDIATTLAVGAVVGGVMWRVAYRRAVTPPVSGVFE